MVNARRTLLMITFLVIAGLTVCITPVARAQEVLPRPAQPVKGKIGRTVKDSIPDFPKEVSAPQGAPNILLIMTDDVGFAAKGYEGFLLQ
jgi:arylsulfatase